MVVSPQVIFSAQQEGHARFYRHPIKLRYEASTAICFAESWLASDVWHQARKRLRRQIARERSRNHQKRACGENVI